MDVTEALKGVFIAESLTLFIDIPLDCVVHRIANSAVDSFN
jgi:hypothetical protein